MKKILQYLKEHLREDFHFWQYASVMGFLSLLIYLNYGLLADGGPFVLMLRQQFREDEGLILIMMGIHSLPYLFAILMLAIFKKRWGLIRKKEFWVKCGLAMLILSVDSAFYYFDLIYELDLPQKDLYYLRITLGKFKSMITMFLPLLLFRLTYDKQQKSLYGLTTKGYDWKPYALMLGLMIPLIFMASFQPDFNTYYPRIKPHQAEGLTLLSQGPALVMFEACYAFDFIWTELIFRGFLIVGMAHVLGKDAVLPMAAIYTIRHFSKPMGETISSFFGGYLLGVIALRSRNIMGGVWVHMGIAVLMELFAFWQIIFR